MVKRIVLTGGPSSGKTSVLEKIRQVYSMEGYHVIVVSETATELINSGIKPFGDVRTSMIYFQELVMQLQLAKEDVVDKALKMVNTEQVIVVYDRGAIDNTAYINEQEFQEVLARLNHVKSFTELMDKYDLVINLVGSKDFYTLENNQARSESSDEAIKLGERTLHSWLGHPRLKVVLPKPSLDEKIREVLNIINESLSTKKVKRQDKYLVDLGNSDLKDVTSGTRVRIEQTYLMSDKDIEKRLRKTEIHDDEAYYLSVYRMNEDGEKLIVSEKSIDKKVYDQLLEFQDKRKKTIYKTRYYFTYQGEYFHLDVFDDNPEIGILEINVSNNERVVIPNYLSVIDDVSKDDRYSNSMMAMIEDVKRKVLE